jgi:hypothetical protein
MIGTSDRLASQPSEIRIVYLPNAILECYHYSNVLGPYWRKSKIVTAIQPFYPICLHIVT